MSKDTNENTGAISNEKIREEMNFETRLQRLEEIVSQMEKGDLALDDSLKLFEEGIQISRKCHSQLDESEQKVKLLLKIDEAGNPITENFELRPS